MFPLHQTSAAKEKKTLKDRGITHHSRLAATSVRTSVFIPVYPRALKVHFASLKSRACTERKSWSTLITAQPGARVAKAKALPSFNYSAEESWLDPLRFNDDRARIRVCPWRRQRIDAPFSRVDTFRFRRRAKLCHPSRTCKSLLTRFASCIRKLLRDAFKEKLSQSLQFPLPIG